MKSERTIVTAGHLGFFLVALPLLLAVGPKECPAAIDVQCGDVLDVDRGQYRLNSDLVCPLNDSFAAVTITGEGVHFNLAGYTITRDEASGAFLTKGILVRGANAHINGGSVVDFNCPISLDPDTPSEDCAGIRLGEAPGARINGMSLHNNKVGIISFGPKWEFGPVGIADDARIHGNEITGNLKGGVSLSGFGGATADGAKITGNDLSNTRGEPGVGAIVTTDGVSVIGNVANNNAGAGILLFGSEAEGVPERNTIRDNTTLDNGLAGIASNAPAEAFRPRDNLIQSNTAFGNCQLPRCSVDLNEAFAGGGGQDCLNTWVDNDFGVVRLDCIE